jgi:hypothetical protein
MFRTAAAALGLVAICGLCSTAVVGQTVAAGLTTELMLSTLFPTTTSVITGGATMTDTSASGMVWANNRAKGFTGALRDQLYTPGACIQMSTMGELLIAYAAVKMQKELQFTDSLQTPISTTLSPLGVTFRNNDKDITYEMLLRHTSTINDALFESWTVVAPAAVGTLANFVESYFVTGQQLRTSAFNSAEPGTANAYVRARANTALMAYILERVLAARSLGDLKSYIVNNILVPFGMSSTFVLNNDGTAPGVTPVPVFTTTLLLDLTAAASYTAFYQGCIADTPTVRFLHPAWPADYMMYTTTADLTRLARKLIIEVTPEAHSDVVNEMKTPFDLRFAASAQTKQAQTKQGLGLMFFNGDQTCASATSTKVISACPVTNASTVIGYVAARSNTLVGFLCAAKDNLQSLMVCTSGTFVYSSTTAAAFDPVFQVAGAAFQDRFGTVTILTPAPTLPLRTDDEERSFGVIVFFGVFLSVIAVFFGTMVMQYLLLPPSLSQVTNTNAFTVGQGTRLSPQRTGPLEYSPKN